MLATALSNALVLHAAAQITAEMGEKGGFEVAVKGHAWFRSGDIAVHTNGKWFSVEQNTLKMAGKRAWHDDDALGQFDAMELNWTAVTAPSWVFSTRFRNYSSSLVFEQYFYDQLVDTSVNNEDELLSIFPSFDLSFAPTISDS